MEILCHRGFWLHKDEQNSLDAFQRAIDHGLGIETDIRDSAGSIVISHDPPKPNSLTFDNLLGALSSEETSGSLALNLKSDGLGELLRDEVGRISQPYFVFDGSVPELVKFRALGLPYLIRRSEFEQSSGLSAESAGTWLDSFVDEWYLEDLQSICENTLGRLIIVSPELHGRDPRQVWSELRPLLYKYSEVSLCTDLIPEAISYFGASVVR